LAAKEGFSDISNLLLQHDAYVNLPDRVSSLHIMLLLLPYALHYIININVCLCVCMNAEKYHYFIAA